MPSIVSDCTNNLPFDLKYFTCAGVSTVYQYDLAILGAILALKFKAVLLVLAVIFGAGAYFKLLPGFGYQNKEYKCQPPILYDSHHHGYNMNHDIPYGHSERSDRASDVTEYSETLEFELLATIMRGYVE